MSSNETSDAPSAISLENKFKELHSNVRHITQLAMNWFAFFVTVNYVTMGWLAKAPDNSNPNSRIVPIVAGVFIVQNVLGVFGLAGVLLTAWKMKKQVRGLKESHPNEGCVASMKSALLSRAL
jgi:hypothetical protein